MGELVTMTAMVLSASNVGDFDKRIVLLTKERGKISAFAKGARRPNSPFVAICQPFSFGQFSFYEGRSSYNLHHAEITNYFQELRSDLDSIYLGMYFCEFADYLTRENNDEGAILKLLYQSLRALGKGTIKKSLVRYIYEIKVLAYYGQAMETFCCVKCKKEEPLVAFDSESGGVLCLDCKKMMKGTIGIHPSTLYALQYILASPLEKLYTFTVSGEVLKQLKAITEQYIRVYVDKKFKTLDFLMDSY
ncbi:MAG TPA: DNA repair protein RecO [Candidatus Scybalomonas excrementigallinarum]|nr:DNA repair protein RecO [Candidatus Scybalomonas excrementigallinarum]